MPITVWRGDLTRLADEGIIAHQVNTKTMGAGLAANLYEVYPLVRKLHQEKAKSTKGWELGEVQLILVDGIKNIYVANCCGQATTKLGVDNCNYQAIEKYLWRLLCMGTGLQLPVWVPDGLGSGLAGGNKKDIFTLLDSRFGPIGDLRLVEYEPDMDLTERD